MLCSVTRTEAFGRRDMPNVETIQQGYQLQGLSEYLGTSKPPDAPPLDWPVPDDDALTVANSFFPLVNYLLTYVTQPNSMDDPVYERIARIGVGPGMPWDPDAQSPEYVAALQAGLEVARTEIKVAVAAHSDATKAYGNRETITTHYLDRTGGVFAGGLAPNVAEQAMYYQLLDPHHKAPNGTEYNYTLTFPPGELPPVGFFWSLTSYSLPERWLVPNRIHRYSIGSRHNRQRLHQEPDGSVILYLQAESPGPEKVSNWLPIADGPAFEILRLYKPSEQVLDGTWEPPPLVRVPRNG